MSALDDGPLRFSVGLTAIGAPYIVARHDLRVVSVLPVGDLPAAFQYVGEWNAAPSPPAAPSGVMRPPNNLNIIWEGQAFEECPQTLIAKAEALTQRKWDTLVERNQQRAEFAELLEQEAASPSAGWESPWGMVSPSSRLAWARKQRAVSKKLVAYMQSRNKEDRQIVQILEQIRDRMGAELQPDLLVVLIDRLKDPRSHRKPGNPNPRSYAKKDVENYDALCVELGKPPTFSDVEKHHARFLGKASKSDVAERVMKHVKAAGRHVLRKKNRPD